MDAPRDVTLLLLAHRSGDPEAFDRLVTLVYQDLRRLAKRALAFDSGRTLSATAVVHEAWMHLSRDTSIPWQNRGQFFGIAARAMRRLVIDDARRQRARKRGGDRHQVTLVPEHLPVAPNVDVLLTIDEVLVRLAEVDARLVQVAECKLFAGLTDAEAAHALGVPLRTVQRDWQRARAWLQRGLSAFGQGAEDAARH